MILIPFFFHFSGSSNPGPAPRTPRLSQGSAQGQQGLQGFSGGPAPSLHLAIPGGALQHEIAQAHAILSSVRARITEAEDQCREYGARMEALG